MSRPANSGLIGFRFFALFVLAPLSGVVLPADSPLPFPLEPPDTSSPRATLIAFMENNARGVELYSQGAAASKILPWWDRAEQTIDLSEVPPSVRPIVGSEVSLLLYEVLGRVGLPETSEIPDQDEVKKLESDSWVVPSTDIRIQRVQDGERQGEFLFDPHTVASALEYYEKVKALPFIAELTPGNYEEYITRPAIFVPYLWADRLPDWAKTRFLRQPFWKWMAAFLLLLAAGIVAMVVRRICRRWDLTIGRKAKHWCLGDLLFALTLTVLPLLVANWLKTIIGIRFEVYNVMSTALITLAFVAGLFAIFAFFEYLGEAIIASKRLQSKSVNANLIKVITRLLAILASIYLIIATTEFLGLALAPVLAGLGIGGLAVALAARPTLENIIGGLILFADKPVRIGDLCSFGGKMGTVEEIGLRSTRIRDFERCVVNVPNAAFSQMELVNMTRRDQRLLHTVLGLRYETTAEQLRYVLANLRAMLLAHPKVDPDPARVRFKDYGAYSKDIEIFAYVRSIEHNDYMAIREDLLLRIHDIVEEAGTGFAFPSQTNYLARDGGLEGDRGREAEAKVEDWRKTGKLPFPEFEAEYQNRIQDSLDYPPEGSPTHEPNN